MNRLINKILKEAKEDDLFFQPKDISGRDEKLKRQREDILQKIELGLENIKVDYENKNWWSGEEKLFLQIFSEFHLDKRYDKFYEGYVLKNKKGRRTCTFNLKYHEFWVSYDHIWTIFGKKFDWDYIEMQSFVEDMLKKHFKVNEFTSVRCTLAF